jgi:hypothetical protein
MKLSDVFDEAAPGARLARKAWGVGSPKVATIGIVPGTQELGLCVSTAHMLEPEDFLADDWFVLANTVH